MHKLAPEVEEAAGLPLLHIGDAIGDALRAAGLTTIGLLGTRFTMEQDFLRDHLSRRHGIETRIPGEADRDWLQHLIYEELCRGRIDARSRVACLTLVDRLVDRGAQGVVLGCTELGLLLDPGSLPVLGFDSTLLHVQQALDWMLADVPEGDPQ
jgi:aspartate racemase